MGDDETAAAADTKTMNEVSLQTDFNHQDPDDVDALLYGNFAVISIKEHQRAMLCATSGYARTLNRQLRLVTEKFEKKIEKYRRTMSLDDDNDTDVLLKKKQEHSGNVDSKGKISSSLQRPLSDGGGRNEGKRTAEALKVSADSSNASHTNTPGAPAFTAAAPGTFSFAHPKVEGLKEESTVSNNKDVGSRVQRDGKGTAKSIREEEQRGHSNTANTAPTNNNNSNCNNNRLMVLENIKAERGTSPFSTPLVAHLSQSPSSRAPTPLGPLPHVVVDTDNGAQASSLSSRQRQVWENNEQKNSNKCPTTSRRALSPSPSSRSGRRKRKENEEQQANRKKRELNDGGTEAYSNKQSSKKMNHEASTATIGNTQDDENEYGVVLTIPSPRTVSQTQQPQPVSSATFPTLSGGGVHSHFGSGGVLHAVGGEGNTTMGGSYSTTTAAAAGGVAPSHDADVDLLREQILSRQATINRLQREARQVGVPGHAITAALKGECVELQPPAATGAAKGGGSKSAISPGRSKTPSLKEKENSTDESNNNKKGDLLEENGVYLDSTQKSSSSAVSFSPSVSVVSPRSPTTTSPPTGKVLPLTSRTKDLYFNMDGRIDGIRALENLIEESQDALRALNGENRRFYAAEVDRLESTIHEATQQLENMRNERKNYELLIQRIEGALRRDKRQLMTTLGDLNQQCETDKKQLQKLMEEYKERVLARKQKVLAENAAAAKERMAQRGVEHDTDEQDGGLVSHEYVGGGKRHFGVQCVAFTTQEQRDEIEMKHEMVQSIAKKERTFLDLIGEVERLLHTLEDATGELQQQLGCNSCRRISAEHATMWPCGHSFCAYCVERFNEADNFDVYQCPSCHSVSTDVPIPNVVMNHATSRLVFSRSGYVALQDALASFRSHLLESDDWFLKATQNQYFPLGKGHEFMRSGTAWEQRHQKGTARHLTIKKN